MLLIVGGGAGAGVIHCRLFARLPLPLYSHPPRIPSVISPRRSLAAVRRHVKLRAAGSDEAIPVDVAIDTDSELEADEEDGEDWVEEDALFRREMDFAADEVGDEEAAERFGESFGGGTERRRDDEFDRDPELGDLLGSCFEDPQKGQARVEERVKRKRNKILHAKTGSATPPKIIFNKFGFSNSYIWFEFYHDLLPNDVTLICNAIRSWHIIGRLGGCNSMNMQLSQLPLETKRPTYDAIQAANVTPTTFYNIGDLEIQDNLARIWVDIGAVEPLLLDVLINALTSISSDHIGIKQVVFGGTEFASWKENVSSEYAGCSTHRI